MKYKHTHETVAAKIDCSMERPAKHNLGGHLFRHKDAWAISNLSIYNDQLISK